MSANTYFDPEAFKREFEAGTPDYGDDGEPLPRGWYPLRLFPVKTDVTKNGVPRVLLSATVMEGPKGGRQFLVEQYLTASRFKRIKGETEGEWEQVERTEDEFKEKASAATFRIKGFMDAAGIETNDTAQGEDESDFLVNYFSVEDWKNVKVMANVDIQRDRNKIKGYRPIDDEKYGLDAFRARLERLATA